MNSKNGTSNTKAIKPRIKKTVLKADEICSILKACVEAKVKVLKYLDLEVSFEGQAEETQSYYHPVMPGDLAGSVRPAAEKEAFEEQAFYAKQDKLDQMMIVDPVEYERLVAAGELEDAEGQN